MADKQEIPVLAKMHTTGPWQIQTHVTHALCSDGKRRRARITAQAPDTFFSIAACVQVSGVSVSGYVTGRETNGAQDYEFHAVQTGKNYALLSE